MLRLDELHPVSGGNKPFKLVENFKHFCQSDFEGIASLGGPFSNHMAALAQAGKDLSIPTVGIIRGEEPSEKSITLRRAEANGMKLLFVSREKYRSIRKETNPLNDFPSLQRFMLIPEGGANEEGVRGSQFIGNYIPSYFTHIVVAVGTGATIAGIAANVSSHQKLIGVKVLEARQEDFILKQVSPNVAHRLSLISDYTFGGYAKKSKVLDEFVAKWNQEQQVEIEPIYTGRLMFALVNMLAEGYFAESAKILVVHSGGLQYLAH